MQTKLKIYEDEPVKEQAKKRAYNRKPKILDHYSIAEIIGREFKQPPVPPYFEPALNRVNKPGAIRKRLDQLKKP